MYNKVLEGKIIIMDDETYVPVDPDQVPGRSYYISDKNGSVDKSIQYKKVEKFSRKVMIWQAIDAMGRVSEPFVTDKSMNSETYQRVIELYLLPFIDKNYKRSDVIFWPDLATSH